MQGLADPRLAFSVFIDNQRPRLTASVTDTTLALVEVDASLGVRQLDIGNSSLNHHLSFPLNLVREDSMNRGVVTLAAAILLLSCSKGTLVIDPATPEEALRDRAEATYQAVAKQDWAQVYQYASPRYRENCMVEDYVWWRTSISESIPEGMELRVSRVSVVEDEGQVWVEVIIDHEPLAAAADEDEPAPWVLLDGEWWIESEDWELGCPGPERSEELRRQQKADSYANELEVLQGGADGLMDRNNIDRLPSPVSTPTDDMSQFPDVDSGYVLFPGWVQDSKTVCTYTATVGGTVVQEGCP